MASFRGIACQWGISTTAIANSGTTIGTGVILMPTGQDLEKSFKSDELMARDGEIAGLVFFDKRQSLGLNLYPSATTIANANAAALVSPGDVLTLTDADTDMSGFSGKWIVRKASKAKRADGKVVWNISVEQYATDLSTPITT